MCNAPVAAHDKVIDQGERMLQLACETTPEEIRLMEDRILAVAEERGADQMRRLRMLLVLDEILTNVRRYAYPEKPGLVRVDILPQVGDDDVLLHMRIHDWGPPFDPLRDGEDPVLEPSVDKRPEGGLGLYLVYNTVCGIRYERVWEEPPSRGRNQLSLSFPLVPARARSKSGAARS